jgi:DNA-binding GntR family transcriptional regulator
LAGSLGYLWLVGSALSPERRLDIESLCMQPTNDTETTAEKTANTGHDLSSTDLVKQALLDRILGGVFDIGERLNENQIAAEFNVSRGPVREALRSLEEAHLVTSIHNRGVFVRSIDLQEALHLYDVRAGLAYTAGKLLAQRATAEQIDALYSMFDEMEVERTARNPQRYFEINERFHHEAMRFAGNPRLTQMSEAIDRELRVFLRHGVGGPSQLRISNEEHRVILDSIAAGNARAAAEAFENHIAAGKLRALDSLITRHGAVR